MTMNAPAQQTLAHDAALASEHVLKSAVALARAEAKLLALRARAEFISALIVVVGVTTAGLFVALCLVILALSPLVLGRETMARTFGSELTPVGLSLGISLALALGGAALAWSGVRRLRAGTTRENDTGATT